MYLVALVLPNTTLQQRRLLGDLLSPEPTVRAAAAEKSGKYFDSCRQPMANCYFVLFTWNFRRTCSMPAQC